MFEINTQDYQAWYEPETHTFFLKGFLRLEGMVGYQDIMDVMLKAMGETSQFTVNLEKLEFLNSSGISMLSMFVVKVRGMKTVQLILIGSKNILWQTKSLRNLQRLMPLTLELV
ncbi:MAG: slr1659 superfamily regulator [Microcystaceae cyanobacterium]